ncbi:hypothetical protein [uncultured Fibrella sp.]|uniref:hypothetical protein n=1 Tax=uncultured Fibrella sp. TaxID=1284596 RepID=UPI0035CA0D26
MLLTYDDFRARTARENFFQFRGSNLKEVDEALQEYWKDAKRGSPQQVIHLINVLKACATWFKRKQGKSDNKSLGGGSDLFIRRKVVIDDLGRAALADLNTALAGASANTITPQQKFAIQFHKNKFNTLNNALTQAPTPTKSMEQSYQPERSTYLASKKVKAVSGTGVHAVHGDINSGSVAMMNQYPAKRSDAVSQALRKDVNLLTDADFKALDEYARKAKMHLDVVYTKREDRDKLMVFVDGQGRLCDVNNVLISTNGPVLYAMDRYGNLFCEKEKTKRGVIYNHSSFNAGNDVICAGGIIIAAGVLMEIDNRSGHYQPSRDNLHNCVEVLQQEGVDLSQAAVSVAYKVGETLTSDEYKATTFLQNKQAPPDRVKR